MKQRRVHVKIQQQKLVTWNRKNSLKMNNVIYLWNNLRSPNTQGARLPKGTAKKIFLKNSDRQFYKMDENLKPRELRGTMNHKCLNHENKNQRNKKKILKAVLDKRHAMYRRTKIRMTANSQWKQCQPKTIQSAKTWCKHEAK